MEDPKVIKSIIKATVISNPLKTTVRQLQYDFKNFEGYEVPYRQMGFSDFTQYLRSIPDTVMVIGSGPQAEVRVVLDQKSAHVAEMVSRQRTVTKKRAPSSRFNRPTRLDRARYIYNPTQHPPQNDTRKGILVENTKVTNQRLGGPKLNQTCHEDKREISPAQNNIKNGIIAENKEKTDQQLDTQNRKGILLETNRQLDTQNRNGILLETNQKFNELALNHIPHEDRRRKVGPDKKLETALNHVRHEDEQVGPAKKLEAVAAATDKVKSEFREISELRRGGGFAAALKEARERKSTPVPAENVNYKVPRAVQENLEQLIKQFPDGIWCSRLPIEYRTRFRTNFDYIQYGYKSLIQLCCELPEIFKFVRPSNCDYRLYHVDAAITHRSSPDGQKRPPSGGACEEEHTTKPAVPENVAEILKSALPLAPPHVVGLDAFLPRQEVVSQAGDYIDIQIAEVYDPSKFWFSLHKHIRKLDALMDEMQSFYGVSGKEYEIPSCLLQDGLYCAAVYMNEYHRAVVTNMMPHSKSSVKVFFLDYGTVSTVSMDGLCYLHNNFSQLPAQAIRGRLAKIHPPMQNEMWSLESSQYFLDFIRNKVLIAQIHARDEDTETFDLIVADTSSEKDIFVNDSIVAAGYARFDHQGWKDVFSYGKYAPFVKDIHLYPTFDEIETALVPSLSELHVISAASVSLDRVFPQYFTEREEVAKEHDGKYTYFTTKNGKLVSHQTKINTPPTTPPPPPESPSISFIVYKEKPSPCTSPTESLTPGTSASEPLLSPPLWIPRTPSPRIYTPPKQPQQRPPFVPLQYPPFPVRYVYQQPPMWNLPVQPPWNGSVPLPHLHHHPRINRFANAPPFVPGFTPIHVHGPSKFAEKPVAAFFENRNAPPRRRSKLVVKTQIFGLNLHVILYDGEPHVLLNEVHSHYPGSSLMLFKRALCMEGSINIIDVDLKKHADLLSELLTYKAVDGTVGIVDLVPLLYLADITKLLGNETILRESFESVLRLYSSDSLIWHPPL